MDTLIRAEGEVATTDLPHIYHLPPSKYFVRHNGVWREYTESSVKVLEKDRWNGTARRGQTRPDLDTLMARIRAENYISAAVCLGWEKEGLQDVNGERVLVMRGGKFLAPTPGTWPIIKTFLINLLGEEQLAYVLGWLQNAVIGYYTDRKRYGQALILAGPPGGGKSFLQLRIITPLLGGKTADPFFWMTGQTQFNSELFEACHLMIEDKFYEASPSARKEFGAALKGITSNQVQTLHRKYLPAYECVPFWRLTISLNDESHNLAVLPETDPSLEGKMLVFNCAKAPLPLPTTGDNPMEREVAKELPGFLHYLLHEHQVPEDLQDGRYHIKAFINPVIREELESYGEENLVKDEMADIFAGKVMKLTTREIMTSLSASPLEAVKRIAASNHRIGWCLRKLGDVEGSGVKFKKTRNWRGWVLDFQKISEEK